MSISIASNLPAQITPGDLDFGTGVRVRRIVSHNPTEIVAELDVAADAVPGKRDIAFRRSVLQSAIAVYDRVDYIKVVPDSALARLGSERHPKGYQQFEAVAYHRGLDGKMHTADDVELGPVDVTWSVEEFYSVYGDDDKEFVGSLSPIVAIRITVTTNADEIGFWSTIPTEMPFTIANTNTSSTANTR